MTQRSTLVLLHFLGGSARSFSALGRALAGRFETLAIDLPGFGDAAGLGGQDVAAMAEHVVRHVRDAAPPRWTLVGHSMGAKVAAVVARRAEDGEAGLGGLAGLVLLAGSPPFPEPMDEAQRATMLGWFQGDAARSRCEAQDFIDANLHAPLSSEANEAIVEEVLRASPHAWARWLAEGSREDWSARIGVLRTPCLLIAGGSDDALGADAQRRLAWRHFADARVVSLPAAAHLLPIEQPHAVARLIAEPVAAGTPAIDQDFRALLASDRVSACTRAVLLARGAAEGRAAPIHFDAAAFATLQAVLDRVVPQTGDRRLDLARRLDAGLGESDGWRFADLPPDPQAWRSGLAGLDAAAGGRFAALDAPAQDALLAQAAAGTLEVADGVDAEDMRLWFEDLRGAAARAYMAHPATLARIGYGGFAYGGDGTRLQGFTRLGIGAVEAWEPPA